MGILSQGTSRSRRLSEELTELQARLNEGPVTIGDVVSKLRGRAYLLLVVLLTLPFLTPLPLPGLSTPFGLVVAFIALRLSLGRRPWLPARLRAKPVPAGFFLKVLGLTARALRILERMMRPRWDFLFSTPFLPRLHAFLILLSSLVLLLPLIIPFSNAFPAWVILLATVGLLERDGLCITLAYAVFAAGVFYFIFLVELGQHLVTQLLAWLGWA